MLKMVDVKHRYGATDEEIAKWMESYCHRYGATEGEIRAFALKKLKAVQ